MATVIDAGLLVALASAEPAATEVRRLLSAWAEHQEPLHAPVLLRYEVASALRRAVWSGALTASASTIRSRRPAPFP